MLLEFDLVELRGFRDFSDEVEWVVLLGVEQLDEGVLLGFAGFVEHVGEKFLVFGKLLWSEVWKCVLAGWGFCVF